MYPISNAVKALYDAENSQVLRITGTDRNGTAISITDENIMENGFNIDRYSSNSSKLEIGTAIAAEMTLKLDNRQGQFNGIIFEGSELYVEIGIADWTQSSPTVTYIPCGYFTPDEQPRSLSVITIHALDRMIRFDAAYQSTAPWTDESYVYIKDENNGVITFADQLSFPITVANLISFVCSHCGVSVSPDMSIQSLPSASLVIDSMPETEQTITFRNLIQWCAGIMGTNAWIDWEGKLRFSWYNNSTGYVSTVENRFTSDIFENEVVITGVTYTKDNESLYIVGTDDYTLDLSGNYLLSGISDTGISSILQSIYTVVHNYAYLPFTASVINAPWLYPMDVITITDTSGNSHAALLTNVNYGINGATALKGIGETSQTNSYAMPSSMTQEQSKTIRRFMQASNGQIDAAIENATKQITGATNSNVRFIYDADGHLTEILVMDTDDISTAVNVWRWNSGGLGHSSNGYNGPYSLALTQDGSIVATMITSGILNAGVLKAGIIQDIAGKNYWNMDTGEFRLAATSTLDGTSVSNIKTGINDAASAASAASSAVTALDNSLNQQGVFNRLTNNGQTQGIYLSNGKVYINGTYIQAGTINANLIRAGIIQDTSGASYWNLANGVMNFVGKFSSQAEDENNDTIKITMDEGGIKTYLNDQIRGRIGLEDGLQLSARNGGTVSVNAYTTDNPGIGESAELIVSANWDIALKTHTISIMELGPDGSLPFPVVYKEGVSGTFQIGNKTVEVTCGLITDIS